MSAAPARRPRRIAIVSHSRARLGGVESYVATLVPALRRAGHTVGCWFETAGHGADSVIAPDDQVPCWVASEQVGAAVGELAAWKPDVVYAHGLASPSHERAVMGVAPVVFFAHSYYGVCISGTKSWQVPVVQPCQRTLRASLPGGVLPAALRRLEPADAGAAVPAAARQARAACAATRASWWRAATWPTSTPGTVWDRRCAWCRCPWSRRSRGPLARSRPTIRGAPGGCSFSADSNPPRAWTSRSRAPRSWPRPRRARSTFSCPAKARDGHASRRGPRR